jgi:hypothetical protein
MTAPLRWDDRTEWELAPKSAWERGQGELLRVFDSAEAAQHFIASSARHINRKRRYRLRRHAGVSVVPVPITPRVVEALLVAGWLSDTRASDRQEIGAEVAQVAECWANEWLK